MSVDWDIRHYNLFYRGPSQTDISITPLLPIGVILLPVCLFYLRRKGESAGYLLCFCIFCVYLWYFASYTIFPFPLHFDPQGFRYAGLHLVPALLEGDDPSFRIHSEQVWGNFMTGVPFGVGLPFVAPKYSTLKRMAWLGLAFAMVPEVIQLLQNVLFVDFMYRSADIDDVWLCFAGTLAGHGVLRGAALVYQRIGWVHGTHLPIWDHIHSVLVALAPGHGSKTAMFRKEVEG